MPKTFTGEPFIVVTLEGGLVTDVHVIGGNAMDLIVLDYDTEGGDVYEHIIDIAKPEDYTEVYTTVGVTSRFPDVDVHRFVVEQIKKWRDTSNGDD